MGSGWQLQPQPARLSTTGSQSSSHGPWAPSRGGCEIDGLKLTFLFNDRIAGNQSQVAWRDRDRGGEVGYEALGVGEYEGLSTKGPTAERWPQPEAGFARARQPLGPEDNRNAPTCSGGEGTARVRVRPGSQISSPDRTWRGVSCGRDCDRRVDRGVSHLCIPTCGADPLPAEGDTGKSTSSRGLARQKGDARPDSRVPNPGESRGSLQLGTDVVLPAAGDTPETRFRVRTSARPGGMGERRWPTVSAYPRC